MSTALVAANQATPIMQGGYTPEQVALIKRTICKDATDDQLKLFLHICQRTGLDPFARQIYATFRRDHKTGEVVMTIQTGIDGFRLTATRTGLYAGRDEAIFEYDSRNKPIKCKVTVYKIVAGVRCAWTATAKWDEYYPGDKMGFMWSKLPETMLEKCCEAKALRMAFPAELSGIYGKEEMDQAEREKPVIGQNLIRAEQPGEDDGFTPPEGEYRCNFGQWRGRSIEDIAKNYGLDKMRNYIAYLESSAEKSGKPLGAAQQEFVERASDFIANWENSPTEGEGE